MPALTRDELTEQLLDLVTCYARKYRGWSFIDNDDLIQQTMIHLLPFIKSYQGENACWGSRVSWAMGAAMSELFSQQGAFILSRREQAAVRRVLRTKECMTTAFGYAPTDEEVAEEMQVPVAIIRRVLGFAHARDALSLDAPMWGDPDDGTVGEFTMDQRSEYSPEQQMMCLDLHTQMLRVLETLEPLEETTIKLRYGFIGQEEYSQQETARELKITLANERVTEIQAMRKLRHPSRSKYLEPFLH